MKSRTSGAGTIKMRSFKLKPLLLLIPLTIILVGLFLIDTPETGKRDASVELQNSIQDGIDAIAQYGSLFPEWTFVVGKTGDLSGGYEPIYEEPDETSSQVAELQYNCVVLPMKEQNYEDWIYVDLEDKGAGYVRKDNVLVDTIQIGSEDKQRDAILNDALQYIGTKFIKGGRSLEGGVDCTNFASMIYANHGIDITPSTRGFRESGVRIEETDLLPGDIIYYDKANDGSGHVGIYLGNNYIINSAGHAGRSYPEGGVRICELTYMHRDSYYPIRVIGAQDE